MTNVTAVVGQIILLFTITAIVCFLRCRSVMTDPVIKDVNTLLQLAWPCMILVTTQKSCAGESVSRFLLVMLVTTAVLSVMCLVIRAMSRHPAHAVSGPVFTILAVLPNAGFVGMPIIQAVYGNAGTLYLAAFLVGFNLVTWTIGVFLFSGVSVASLRKLINPGFLSAIIGTLLFLLRVALPAPLLSTVTQPGSLTTPLSMLLLGARLEMLLLGARLEQVSMPLLRQARLWAAAGIKLLMPLATFALMRACGMDPALTGITVMAMSIPSASVAQLLAEKHGNDVPLAAAGVSITMLLCIVTMLLVVLLAM